MRALAVCACALGLLQAAAHAKTKLAVLGIEAVDEGDVSSQEKTAGVAKNVTDVLRGRVSLNAAKFTVPPNANKELTEVKILSNCLDESVGCMVGVGKELGAEKVMFGKLEKEKGGYTLTLKLLNVGGKSLERSPKSITLSSADAANEASLKDKVGGLFADLTGTELTGSLTVKANVETGTVSVGGDPKAELAGGVATVSDLPEGSLLVSVESKGYKTSEQQVAIVGGKSAHVEFTLESDGGEVVTPPPGGGEATPTATKWKIVGWSGIVLGAALGGFAAWAHWGVEQPLEQDVHDRAAAAMFGGNPCDLAANKNDCDKGKKYANLATYLGPAGAVIGVAGLGVLIFKGYGGSGADSAESVAQHRLVFTPIVSSEGAGGSFVLTF